ncbi:response regulator [Flavobacterium sp.]|uniref:response regulator n=1 Tax=Flavobacterium sp. TaxID=239 RepID=UPI0026276B87|nr:response regulator [Flavobacterium sp.]
MKHSKSLILIDDDEIVVYLTKKIVSQNDLVELIKVFNNGKDAIDYLKENINNVELLPEIIFLDLFMPIMDGWEFLDEYIKIRPRIGKAITIYIISSSVSPTDINRAKKYSEVSDYIIKPVTKNHFLDILKNL